MPKSEAWCEGFAEAERQFYEAERKGQADWYTSYTNPYREDTDEWFGFEEGFYTFTQK